MYEIRWGPNSIDVCNFLESGNLDGVRNHGEDRNLGEGRNLGEAGNLGMACNP